MKWLVRTLVAVAFVFGQCVDEWSVPLAGDYPIVVDATITDRPGPHKVRIYRSVAVNERANANDNIRNARVEIIDTNGNVESLEEIEPGSYETSASFLPAVDTGYKLRIETVEGNIFESSIERLLPGSPIDTLFALYNPARVDNLGQEVVPPSMRVYVTTDFETSGGHYLRWRWEGVYEVRTFPELHQTKIRGEVYPDPRPCSGYVALGQGIQYVGPPCDCCSCWVTERGDRPTVQNLASSDSQHRTGKAVADIAIDRRHFFKKYYIKVQQLRISPEAFAFWEQIEEQYEASQNIFQPNANRIKGNINLVKGKVTDDVLGFFSVASVMEREMFIERIDVPILVQPIDTVRETCVSLEHSTKNKPAFWK